MTESNDGGDGNLAAAALFRNGVGGGAAASRVAGMDMAEFRHWLGERWISQPLRPTDYPQEHQTPVAWLEEDWSSEPMRENLREVI